MKRKLFVFFSLAGFITLGIAATTRSVEYKNLKVLPKNIKPEMMDSVMHEFEKGLGVDCAFCHAKSKANPDELDFASDENPQKLIARKMIDMTNKINEKFFESKSKYGEENAVLEIKCITCHHKVPHPSMLDEEENVDGQ
ncbi:MAG: c-type cytochrome [Chitinophagaceae bacterium]